MPRILILDLPPESGITAMLEALRRMDGREGPYTLIVGSAEVAAANGIVNIPDAWIGKDVIVDYKLRTISRDPDPVFTGVRRSKGDRKRNKASRWT